MHKVKGVLFDLDGVITDTAELHYSAWEVALQKKYNMQLPSKYNFLLRGVERTTAAAIILKEELQILNHQEILEFSSFKNQIYRKSLSNLNKQDILPGISNFIDELVDNNIKISLASASINAPEILRHLELIDKFSAIIDPTTVKKGKPAPDIFIKAAEAINVPTDSCVGIEDSLVGIKALKSAGITSVGVGIEDYISKADFSVATTNKINMALINKIKEV